PSDGRGSEETPLAVDPTRDEMVLRQERELEGSRRTGVGRAENADHHAAPGEVLDGLRGSGKVLQAPGTPRVVDEAGNRARLMHGAECNDHRIGLKAVVVDHHRTRPYLERPDLPPNHPYSSPGQP